MTFPWKHIIILYILFIWFTLELDNIECKAKIISNNYKVTRHNKIIKVSTISYCDGLHENEIYPKYDYEAEQYIKLNPTKIFPNYNNIINRPILIFIILLMIFIISQLCVKLFLAYRKFITQRDNMYRD